VGNACAGRPPRRSIANVATLCPDAQTRLPGRANHSFPAWSIALPCVFGLRLLAHQTPPQVDANACPDPFSRRRRLKTRNHPASWNGSKLVGCQPTSFASKSHHRHSDGSGRGSCFQALEYLVQRSGRMPYRSCPDANPALGGRAAGTVSAGAMPVHRAPAIPHLPARGWVVSEGTGKVNLAQVVALSRSKLIQPQARGGDTSAAV